MKFKQNEQKNNEIYEYLKPYPINKIRIPDSAIITKQILDKLTNDSSENLYILALAINIVAAPNEKIQFFLSLINKTINISTAEAVEIFNKINNQNMSLVSQELINELKFILNVSRAEERGFIYDEKKQTYSFNANVCAKHLIKRCDIYSIKDGRLFFYHKGGFYDELSVVKLGKIIRTVLHEGRSNSWKSQHEQEIVKALQREAKCVEDMNMEKDVINLKNGILNLDTFEILAHNPQYLSTIQLPISYDNKALAPRFIQFLKEITCGDNELIVVIQEMIAYLLSSDMKAEKAFFLLGSGANGKSVLTTIITYLIGKDNISSIPLSEFNKQFGLEGIINKKVNIAAENEMGGKSLNTENFKAIISGDNIEINIKYKPSISYRPTCKLVFVTNNLPDTLDITNGFFRKIMIIPFLRTFKPEERNVNLTNELLEELPGILNWAIEGLKRLRENNFIFSKCKVIEEYTNNYCLEQNPVKEFFMEHVKVAKDCKTKQSDFYKKYIYWLALQGIDDKGTKAVQTFWKNFKIVLENEQIKINRKKVTGVYYYDGIDIVGLDDRRNSFIDQHNIQF
ncbi:DNA primase family protein [Sedimentibacter saalensis]|uniref:Putative DNA primase/helicase n=1 Tax=Sedimentibacter saalensis TaxID=130788 RepID=A0A562JIA0_9FIRM|nr:phage/plasmid primase, P4 family [Sedimentibacter saalensis]TWH82564.1 putative DNA primase/helicase [Sedimentibacter saalensis]